MTYPIIHHELTIHLHNKDRYLRPIEEQAKIPGSVDYGWHRFSFYLDSFTPGQQKKKKEA